MLNSIDTKVAENILELYDTGRMDRNFKNNKVIEWRGFGRGWCDLYDNFYLWSRNKKHIYELFGEKVKMIQELNDVNLCNDHMVNQMRGDLLEGEGRSFNVLIKGLISNLKISEIRNNTLERDITILDVTIKKGLRVTRAFALLELNKKRLAEQQDIYSTFLQGLNVKGRLVLSIDPADYLTMSISRSGWSSCHHLMSEFGTGCLSYMNDESTIIAYVESDTPMNTTVVDSSTGEETEVKMTNKIWRQIVTINSTHDYAIQMSQYPNVTVAYQQATAELLTKILRGAHGEDFIVGDISNDEYRHELQHPSECLEERLFYCDFYNDNYNSLHAIFKERLGTTEKLIEEVSWGRLDPIWIGEEIYCACGCGSLNYSDVFFSCM